MHLPAGGGERKHHRIGLILGKRKALRIQYAFTLLAIAMDVWTSLPVPAMM